MLASDILHFQLDIGVVAERGLFSRVIPCHKRQTRMQTSKALCIDDQASVHPCLNPCPSRDVRYVVLLLEVWYTARLSETSLSQLPPRAP